MALTLTCPIVGSSTSATAPCGLDSAGNAIIPQIIDAGSLASVDWATAAQASGYVIGTMLLFWITAYTSACVVKAIR